MPAVAGKPEEVGSSTIPPAMTHSQVKDGHVSAAHAYYLQHVAAQTLPVWLLLAW